jgi:DNA polymerase-4
MALFALRTPLVEPISLDEAFLDVTGTAHLFGGPEQCGRDLKRHVLEQVGLVLSVGLASNKLCAKVASDLRKPDGFVIVPRGGEAAFLAPLPLKRLWGVGPKTQQVLEDLGMKSIGDLARADPALLDMRLGEHGSTIQQRAQGIDEDREVLGEPAVPKSIGHAHTFDRDTLDRAQLENTLLRLAEGVGRRLRRHALRGRTITLQLRVAPFETRTRQRTLTDPTSDDLTIYETARALLREALAADRQAGRVSPVRLVGVTASGLGGGEQLDLFTGARVSRLNAAMDAVRARFGDEALDRASAREASSRRRLSDRRPR